jgi:hypothetical protein
MVDVPYNCLAINYDKSVAQVFEDVASFFARTIPNLSLLIHVEETESCKRREGLPSWVPDWTRQWTLKSKTRYERVPGFSQGLLDPPYYPTGKNGPHSPPPCILPGILALPRYDQGSVKALLTQKTLPDPGFSASVLQERLTTENIMDWIRTIGPGVQETIEMLIDYHIEITSNLSESRLLLLKRAWSPPDISISEVYSVLEPFVTKWASQPHIARTVAAVGRSEKFQGVQAKELRDLTTLFIKNLQSILRYFEPGSGPIALLNSGSYVQVPPLTRVGDTIFTFAGREETFILRPEHVKKDPESEEYIAKYFRDCGAWEDTYLYPRLRHFKYVAYDNRIWEPGRFYCLPGISMDILTTVILH